MKPFRVTEERRRERRRRSKATAINNTSQRLRAQEPIYLTAQTCQLRDANETRLRIYEALEQSVAELERNNRALQDEGKTDKKRIKALCASLELVEQHCEELQEEVDTMRVPANISQLHPVQRNHGQSQAAIGKGKRARGGQGGVQYEQSTKLNGVAGGRSQSDYTSSEESSHTDEESGIHGSDESDFAGFEDTPLELQEVLRLRSELARLRSQISREQRMRESLSSELEKSVQENARLRDELLSSRERERLSLNIQMEMGGSVNSFDLANEEKSHGADEEDEVCEGESEIKTGEFAVGAVEEGSTLLYELDMQYRVLIEKYEALLEARKRDIEAEDAMTVSIQSQVPSDAEVGPDHLKSYEMVNAIGTVYESNNPTSKNVACQTDIRVLKKRNFVNPAAPITVAPSRSSYRLPVTEPAISTNRITQFGASSMSNRKTGSCLSTFSEADQETFNKHFEHSPPEYKKLFAEIFAVLKKKVAEMPMCDTINERQPTPVLPDLGSRLECDLEKLKATVPPHVRFTRSYAEVVRARQQQQAQQSRAAQAQRNGMIVGGPRGVTM